jgi:RHS repeat-associated protein
MRGHGYAVASEFPYNLRFPGQYYMAETGLNQNWNRDYDPMTGKYIESDPVGLKGGINTYTYVTDNPIWYADPMGLAAAAGGLDVCNEYLNQFQRYRCRYYLAAYLICRTADYNPVFTRDPAANRNSLRAVTRKFTRESA